MSPDKSSSSPLRLILVTIGLLAVLGAAVFAFANERNEGDDAVVASVDGVELTLGELRAIADSRPGATSVDAPTIEGEAARSVINQWLVVEAVIIELETAGEALSAADEAATRDGLALQATQQGLPAPPFDTAFGRFELRTQTLVNKMREIAADTVAGSDITVEIPEGDYFCSSHILLETEEDALEVLAEIEAGLDFASAAVQYSTGPSGPNGGDLSCATPDRYVPEFADAAVENGPGVTDPVESDFGWHIINVRSLGPFGPENHADDAEFFENARNTLEAEQRSMLEDEVFNGFVTAGIERVKDGGFADERFGVWDAERGALAPNG